VAKFHKPVLIFACKISSKFAYVPCDFKNSSGIMDLDSVKSGGEGKEKRREICKSKGTRCTCAEKIRKIMR
jgi:hypothetical protein